MPQLLDIWIDLKRCIAVEGPNSTSAAAFRFAQNDTVTLVLHGLLPNLDSQALGGEPYESASISWAGLKAGILLLDAPPVSGGFRIKILCDPPEITPRLAFNISKEKLTTVLNALPSVLAAGGLTVLSGGATNIYRIRWNNPAQAIDMEVTNNQLNPRCLWLVTTDAEIPGKVELKIWQAPITWADDFNLPTPPSIAISTVRSGSVSRNEVQRIVVPVGAVGQFALKVGGIAGSVMSVAASASEIQAALNAPYTTVDASDQRFSVTQRARGVFDVEFVGVWAKADQPAIDFEMFDQDPLPTPSAEMPLTGPRVEDFLDGKESRGATFELAAFDGDGKKTMLVQQPCVIVNNGIDGEVASQVEDVIGVRTDTVYVYADASAPVIIGQRSVSFVVETSSDDYTFNHPLNTQQPLVEAWRRIADDPEQWMRLPDDSYTAESPNATQLHVYDFGFTPDPGELKVIITNPDAQAWVNDHEHPTSQVYEMTGEVKKTLASILEDLRNTLPTGWPNIPANKITGALGVANIPVELLAEALASSAAFSKTLAQVIAGDDIMNVIAGNLSGNAAFLETFKTVAVTPDVLTLLAGSLKDDSAFFAAIRDLFSTLLQSAGTPQGVMVIDIPELAEVLFWKGPLALAPKGSPTGLPLRSLPAMLPAVHSSDDPDDLPSEIPAASTISPPKLYKNAGTEDVIISIGNRIPSEKVKPGGFVACDGRSFYPVTRYGATNSYYASAFDRGLFQFSVSEKNLREGRSLTCLFGVAVQAINANSQASWVLELSTGTAPQDAAPSPVGLNLQNIVWNATPALQSRLIVGPLLATYFFGLRITRTSSGFTLETQEGGVWEFNNSVAPTSANFTVRGRLGNFDTENNISDARGHIFYRLIGPNYASAQAVIA